MSTPSSGNLVLSINGTDTVCSRLGKGPPLLLIHGGEGSRKSFEHLMQLLASDFTVIAYDQRDCGETVNSGPAATLAVLAADAQHVVRTLGYQDAFVFGSSFGGRVAQVMALDYPESVARLVLGSTWAVDEALLDINREVVERAALLRDQLPTSAPALAELFFPLAFLDAEPQYRSHFSRAPSRTERTARRGITVAEAPAKDPGGIHCRTLVLAGADDTLVPPQATLSLANRIAGARVEVLAGVGHISYVQAPERVAHLLRDFYLSDSGDAAPVLTTLQSGVSA